MADSLHFDPLGVVMLDLLSVVPYYTAHLVGALQRRPDVCVETAAIPYHLDPQCHQRLDVALPDWPSNRARHCRSALPRRVLKTLEAISNLHCLRHRLRADRPDILHVQFTPLFALGLPFELQLIRSVRRLAIPVVYTVHNVLPHEGGARTVARYQRLYSECDQLICHDDASRQRLIDEFKMPPDRVAVIPHGPLLTSRGASGGDGFRRAMQIDAGAPLVVCQGILRSYKGIDVLLDAWQTVAECAPAARLIVAGSGEPEMVRRIQAQIAAANLASSVRFEPRFLSVEELEALHDAGDVLVYPYRAITTSGALLTGIGHAKAIVASRLPAFASLLREEDNALLAVPGDAADLARQLLRLLEDPCLRARIAQSGRPVESWDDIAGRTAALYHRLCGGGAR